MSDPHLPHALRILARDIHCEDGIATQCIREAADEIDRLRAAIRRLAEQDATLSVCEGNVTVDMDATLTDAEREAVEWASDAYENCFCQRVGLDNNGPDDCGRVAATLRGLLERTK